MADKSRNAAAESRRSSRGAALAVQPVRAGDGSERWEDAVAVVSVRGELDRDGIWAIDYTVERATLEAGRIVLDLLEVTHVDYAGVGDLVDRRRVLIARGGDLRIAVKNPYVANILKAAGGTELVLCRSVEEARGEVALALARPRATLHALPALRRKGT